MRRKGTRPSFSSEKADGVADGAGVKVAGDPGEGHGGFGGVRRAIRVLRPAAADFFPLLGMVFVAAGSHAGLEYFAAGSGVALDAVFAEEAVDAEPGGAW